MPMRLLAVLCLLLSAVDLGAQTPLQLQLFASGLNRPMQVTTPVGDLGRVFVVEQPGRIRIVRNGVLLPTPFLDMTSLIVFGGENGLLSLAFHPNYATNGQFFVFYTPSPFPTVAVRRYTVSAGNPDVANASSGVVLMQQPMVYGNHNAGMIQFGLDGYLYISIGDGGSQAPLWPEDPLNHAQRGDSLLGKILRIDVNTTQPPLAYGIPPTNPFIGPGDPRDEIWAFGFRNPWRFGFDRLTGDLYIADVGGQKEEVNFEAAGSLGGRNYGWACMTGFQCNPPLVCTCNSPALTAPIHDYGTASPAHAIIGGFVYRGVAIPDLRGTYFFADYMRVETWSFRRTGAGLTQLTNRTVELTPPSPHFLVGPTGFGEDAFGEMYLCDFAGKVYKIVPNGAVQTGVTLYGSGTAGCVGAHALTAIASPVIGNPSFSLRCNNGPASSFGIMVLASDADVLGSDPLGLGFTAHVQVTSSLLLLHTILSDAAGVGSFAFPIPPSAPLIGYQLNAQALWLWPPAVCVPSPFQWSSSNGLGITLQP